MCGIISFQQFTACRVGAHVWNTQNNVPESSAQSSRRSFGLKSLFQKNNTNVPGIKTIPLGTQDDQYGVPVTLNGQVGSVCIFHEAVTANQVRKLYTMGPNNLTVFTEEPELQDLPPKLLLYYNARVSFCSEKINYQKQLLSSNKLSCIGNLKLQALTCSCLFCNLKGSSRHRLRYTYPDTNT